MADAIYKGDDTAAFGNDFITISLENPESLVVSKAIFTCGDKIEKTFLDPVFPLVVNLTSEETEILNSSNICHLVVYDSEGRQRTCDGSLTFNAKKGVLPDGDCC